jgi:hypothetical protein
MKKIEIKTKRVITTLYLPFVLIFLGTGCKASHTRRSITKAVGVSDKSDIVQFHGIWEGNIGAPFLLKFVINCWHSKQWFNW